MRDDFKSGEIVERYRDSSDVLREKDEISNQEIIEA
jgi:hypothetical protein